MCVFTLIFFGDYIENFTTALKVIEEVPANNTSRKINGTGQLRNFFSCRFNNC